MIDMEEILRQLSGNAQAMRALVQSLSEEQARWRPNPETWSMKEVMEHIYNEERLDFRSHLKEILSDPPQAWEDRRSELASVETCRQALEGFLREREASIAWLKELGTSGEITEREILAPWGRVFKVGDLLFSWVGHDFLHIRQMNELLYAWNEKQAAPFSVEYAGGW